MIITLVEYFRGPDEDLSTYLDLPQVPTPVHTPEDLSAAFDESDGSIGDIFETIVRPPKDAPPPLPIRLSEGDPTGEGDDGVEEGDGNAHDEGPVVEIELTFLLNQSTDGLKYKELISLLLQCN